MTFPTVYQPMLRRMACILWFVAALCVSAPVRAAQNSASSAVVVIGNARFTVITRELIRMEYAPDGQFVDDPSIFAVNRSARFAPKVTTNGGGATIDTGEISLTYQPDGKPFDAANLHAEIAMSGQPAAHWAPGMADPQNLGGTLRTLDGAIGPENLGQGILSRSGWSVVDDSGSPLLTRDWVKARPQAANTDWYLFGYGLDYHGAMASYAAISGPAPLPRKYVLGAWYSRYWPYTSRDYRQIVAQYAQHDFPLDNIVLDMDWHRAGWTGWSWNRALLPDAEDLLKWFHDQGLHVTLNLHPADGVSPKEDQYAAFMKALGQDPASKKTAPFDAASKPYMDALKSTILDPLTREGVDFWWLDWQQYPNTRSIPGLTNLFWLNTFLFEQTAQNNLRGQSFSRWAGLGDQRHPIEFSGDANTGFDMLGFEPVFTATAGNVGCFFWSHDIGGHMGGRNEESYARWCQFGAVSPALRSHSTRDPNMDRRPWTYPQWAEDSMRASFHLRSELFPYIYTQAQETCSRTVPLVRPLYFDYPGVERAYHNAQEYLFGDDLLAAPIASAGIGEGRVATQTVFLPADSNWYNWFTGERYDAGSEALVAADIDEFPLYARAGVPIPMQPYTQRMASTPLTTVVLRCYPGDEGVTGRSTLYEDDGVSSAYQKGAFATTALSYVARQKVVTVDVEPSRGKYDGQPEKRAYRIVLPDTARPASAYANGSPAGWTYDPATFTTVVTVPEMSIRDRLQVDVAVTPDGIESLQRAAIARRLSGILERAVPDPSLAAVLRSPDYAKLDSAGRKAALAVFGLGVVAHNDGVNLYDGAVNSYVYLPEGLVDGDRLMIGDELSQQATPSYNTGRFAVPAVYGSAYVRGQAQGAPFDIQYESFPLDSRDLARSATVTVSSTERGYRAAGVNDGLLGGYPLTGAYEWASDAQGAGAWVRFSWKTLQTINMIALFDRPNLTDQVTSGEIEFSDGSRIPFGELPNDGQSPLAVRFSPKTISWFRVNVTNVSAGTENAGFSEIAAYDTLTQ